MVITVCIIGLLPRSRIGFAWYKNLVLISIPRQDTVVGPVLVGPMCILIHPEASTPAAATAYHLRYAQRWSVAIQRAYLQILRPKSSTLSSRR